MKVNNNPRIWEFDVDNTLICWDLSKFPTNLTFTIASEKGPVTLVPHIKNINLLVKLAKIGWYITVHSGSGCAWAKEVVEALGIEGYVDEVRAKPLGRTDDQPPGDGLAYKAFRHPVTGEDAE